MPTAEKPPGKSITSVEHRELYPAAIPSLFAIDPTLTLFQNSPTQAVISVSPTEPHSSSILAHHSHPHPTPCDITTIMDHLAFKATDEAWLPHSHSKLSHATPVAKSEFPQEEGSHSSWCSPAEGNLHSNQPLILVHDHHLDPSRGHATSSTALSDLKPSEDTPFHLAFAQSVANLAESSSVAKDETLGLYCSDEGIAIPSSSMSQAGVTIKPCNTSPEPSLAGRQQHELPEPSRHSELLPHPNDQLSNASAECARLKAEMITSVLSTSPNGSMLLKDIFEALRSRYPSWCPKDSSRAVIAQKNQSLRGAQPRRETGDITACQRPTSSEDVSSRCISPSTPLDSRATSSAISSESSAQQLIATASRNRVTSGPSWSASPSFLASPIRREGNSVTAIPQRALVSNSGAFDSLSDPSSTALSSVITPTHSTDRSALENQPHTEATVRHAELDCSSTTFPGALMTGSYSAAELAFTPQPHQLHEFRASGGAQGVPPSLVLPGHDHQHKTCTGNLSLVISDTSYSSLHSMTHQSSSPNAVLPHSEQQAADASASHSRLNGFDSTSLHHYFPSPLTTPLHISSGRDTPQLGMRVASPHPIRSRFAEESIALPVSAAATKPLAQNPASLKDKTGGESTLSRQQSPPEEVMLDTMPSSANKKRARNDEGEEICNSVRKRRDPPPDVGGHIVLVPDAIKKYLHMSGLTKHRFRGNTLGKVRFYFNPEEQAQILQIERELGYIRK
ncbi:hypothetical protein DL93DRAFT_2170280 [Clavulina sp. PMI_390]|nr:hypothetical protein DL93DRAFT_2170280 [Clavulina sp. PMI_390]